MDRRSFLKGFGALGLSTLISMNIFAGNPGGKKEMNSFLGIQIGMFKEDVILIIKKLGVEYDDNLERIKFLYEIIKDDVEDNIIRVFYKDNKVVEIQIYFYSYHMSDARVGGKSKRFQAFLDKLDEVYDNDINWAGKWRSKDKTILVKTTKFTVEGKIYDILIIKDNTTEKENKNIENPEISI